MIQTEVKKLSEVKDSDIVTEKDLKDAYPKKPKGFFFRKQLAVLMTTCLICGLGYGIVYLILGVESINEMNYDMNGSLLYVALLLVGLMHLFMTAISLARTDTSSILPPINKLVGLRDYNKQWGQYYDLRHQHNALQLYFSLKERFNDPKETQAAIRKTRDTGKN